MRRKKHKGKAYSDRKLKTPALIVIAIASYLFVIALAITLIIAIPYFGHRDNLLNLAQDRGEYTITHFTEYTESTFRTEYYLFSEYGSLVTSDQPYLASHETSEMREMVPSLLASGTEYKLAFFGDKSVGQRLVILAGKRIAARSERRFVSFIIWSMDDIFITIATFIGLITLLYLTGMIIVIYLSKQHRDLMILQRDLISNVSHELKTPITSIKAMGELLYDGMYQSEDELKRYSQTILQESDKLNEYVREILNLAQLQSHKAVFNKMVCFSDGVFTPLLDHYMMMCSDLGIDMDLSGLSLNSIPPLYTDPVQIKRVWMIILDNAMKFAGKGGKISVTQKLSNDYVIFSIHDDGPGISPNDIKRVFERFYKADTTHNSQGSGLGLAIAHEIISGLNEKIWVESAEGNGCTFFFTISFK